MDKSAKIYVAGHQGLVGSALMWALGAHGYTNIITRSFADLDLRNQTAVDNFFKFEQPEYVFLAAAKVGGILANNTYRAEFIYDNLMIAANIIHASYKYGVKKLLNLGSSCIYPKNAPQPLKEEYLLTGSLEETNEPYAIAKIAAIKLCRYYNEQYGTNFISVMPTNLYGPHDNFDLKTAHVLPALLRKFHAAKIEGKQSVLVWGSGEPRREFLFVDDLADALLFLMKNHDACTLGEIINIGSGIDVSVYQLAKLIHGIVGFNGQILYDATKPDGVKQKLLDVSRMTELGWSSSVTLEEGIKRLYQWYCQHADSYHEKKEGRECHVEV